MPKTEPVEKDLRRRLYARERQILKQARKISALTQGIAEHANLIMKLRADLERWSKVIDAYHIKNEFISGVGREALIVKAGSREHKWTPSPARVH